VKTKLMAITLAMTTALSAGAAFADPNDNYRGGPQQNQPNDRRDMHQDQNMYQNMHQDQNRHDGGYQQHQSNDRRDDHHWTPRYQQNHQAYRHDMPRPGQEWRRGGRVPLNIVVTNIRFVTGVHMIYQRLHVVIVGFALMATTFLLPSQQA
jgi:hypothetical protein